MSPRSEQRIATGGGAVVLLHGHQLEHNLALATGLASVGHFSGAHLNPAVTLGLAVNRRFPWACVPGYVIAQFTGAIAAAAATGGLFGTQARSVARLGAPGPAAAVATDTRVPRGIAAMTIGAALAVAIVISGPVSGAGVNPARAIGPMILAGEFSDWWAYLAATVAAGEVAVALCDRFLRAASTPA